MNIISRALCLTVLFVPVVALAADDAKGCDSVNWGQEVLAKFPNAQKGCRGVMTKEGNVYAHYMAKVVSASADSVTVNMLDKDNKPFSEVTFVPGRSDINVNGKPTKVKDLKKGTDIDFWIQHNRWGLYSDPGKTPMTVLSRRDL